MVNEDLHCDLLQEPIGPRSSCPVHSAEYAAILGNRYRNLYNKLVESNQEDEESDMEASDAEVDEEDSDDGARQRGVGGGGPMVPLSGALRAISAAQQAAAIAAASAATQQGGAAGPPPSSSSVVGFVPRKLSTISSKGSFAATRDEEVGDEEERSPLRGTTDDSVVDEVTVLEKEEGGRGETRAVIEAR